MLGSVSGSENQFLPLAKPYGQHIPSAEWERWGRPSTVSASNNQTMSGQIIGQNSLNTFHTNLHKVLKGCDVTAHITMQNFVVGVMCPPMWPKF